MTSDVSGILHAPVKPGHDSGWDVKKHSRGTHAPESCIINVPQEREGAGNAGCSSHPQPCVQVKKARKQVTTGTPKHSGIPCTTVYGL